MNQSPRTLDATGTDLIQITIPVGMLQCNCTIIADPITREALVIDPGDEITRVLELLGRHKLTVKAIVSTHAHIDHVGGLAKLRQYTGAPVLMHRDDLPLYHAMDVQASFLGVPAPEIVNIDQLLKEGDALHWGSYQASIVHTPGHTPGSVCLYLPKNIPSAKSLGAAGPLGKLNSDKKSDDKNEAPIPGIPNGNLTVPHLFAGDTLFAGSIGRTDLWGGSMEQLMDSLRTKLMELPDDTKVFPGHGVFTTILQERETNPFLKRR
jgi:glyoxylase-like metal-dependent hydrolase (beta-lactamase superfamily II)